MRKLLTLAMLLAALLALFSSAAGSGALPAVAQAAVMDTTWHVAIGGETPDMAMQTMAFYPGVLTIDAGDTVTWKLASHEPHTVTFLSGTKPISALSPEATMPAGGSSYDGTGVVSSGELDPVPGHDSYSLSFTKPGIYIYNCLFHPGMQGVVIVQPAGAPYPATQAQYDANRQQQTQTDLANGLQAVASLPVVDTSPTNGGMLYQVSAGGSPPEMATVALHSSHGSSATGNAGVTVDQNGNLNVQIQLTGLDPNSKHPAHVHLGTCGSDGGIAFPLNDVVADSTGLGVSSTSIPASQASNLVGGAFAIPANGWAINVHAGPTMAGSGKQEIACGDVVYSNNAAMRFYPGTLHIHVGDTVRWTQVSPQEAHTITFAPAGQNPPEFPNPDAVNPEGGASYDGSGLAGSGVLFPGQSYQLAFTKPGIYGYICVIHDGMGMTGVIVVAPPSVPGS